jgi:death on curing protein
VKDWFWVELAAVLAAHDRLLADYGGPDGMRDMGALGGALRRPQHLAACGEPDIADLAALYAVGIAKAHFVDGNKRVAWATARAFLRLNGHNLEFDKAEAVGLMVRVAEREVESEAMARWLRPRLRGM